MPEIAKVTEDKKMVPSINRPGRYEALDGMRGIAVLLVVLFHVAWPNHITQNGFFRNGYLMVDLFFILSGFVLSTSHRKQLASTAQIGTFLIQRLFRVYPMHFVVLMAFVVLELIKLLALSHGTMAPHRMPFSDPNSVEMLVANIFLVQSLGIFGSLSWNGPSWYISCLFAVYVLYAVGVFSIAFRNRITFIAAIVLALLGYVVLAHSYQSLNITYDLGLVRCICGFFLGMAVYRLSEKYDLARVLRLSEWQSRSEIAVVVAMVLVMSLATGWLVVLAIPVFVLMIIIFETDDGVVSGFLKSRIARYLSRISYSVYIVQMFILVVASMVLNKVFKVPMVTDPLSGVPHLQIDPLSGDTLVAVVLLLLLASGTAAHFLIEEPARLFGKRLVVSLQKHER